MTDKPDKRSGGRRGVSQWLVQTLRHTEAPSWFAILIGAATAVLTLSGIGDVVFSGRQEVENLVRAFDRAVQAEFVEKLEGVSKDLSALRTQVGELTALPPEVKVGIHVEAVDEKIEALNTRLASLEQAILANPAKALEMPLLRNDLEALRKSGEDDMTRVQGEISRVYDLNKWFLGLMFTMALGIVSLAVTNLVKSGREGVKGGEK